MTLPLPSADHPEPQGQDDFILQEEADYHTCEKGYRRPLEMYEHGTNCDCRDCESR